MERSESAGDCPGPRMARRLAPWRGVGEAPGGGKGGRGGGVVGGRGDGGGGWDGGGGGRGSMDSGRAAGHHCGGSPSLCAMGLLSLLMPAPSTADRRGLDAHACAEDPKSPQCCRKCAATYRKLLEPQEMYGDVYRDLMEACVNQMSLRSFWPKIPSAESICWKKVAAWGSVKTSRSDHRIFCHGPGCRVGLRPQ